MLEPIGIHFFMLLPEVEYHSALQLINDGVHHY